MTITYHPDILQGSDSWFAARCGLLTASEMHLIVTPTLKAAANDKERAHVWELAAQRFNDYVEPSYVGDNMLRGYDDEIAAKALYSQHYAPVQDMGFITNDEWGFTLGFSPDGLIGEDGFIECKSRKQKFQFEAIAELEVHKDFIIQLQTGFLVSGRSWCDHISYCSGMPMLTLRVHPDPVIANAIIEAAGACEKRILEKVERFRNNMKSRARLIPTVRREIKEMYV